MSHTTSSLGPTSDLVQIIKQYGQPLSWTFLSPWSGVGRATLLGENSWFANFNLEAYLLGDKFSYNLALFQFFSNLDCLARFPIF